MASESFLEQAKATTKILDYIPGFVGTDPEEVRIEKLLNDGNSRFPRVVTLTPGRRYGLHSANLWREYKPENPCILVVEAGLHHQAFEKAEHDPLLWPLVIKGRMSTTLVHDQALKQEVISGAPTDLHSWKPGLLKLQLQRGASFVLTQPVYDTQNIQALVDICTEFKVGFWIGVQRPRLVREGMQGPAKLLSWGTPGPKFGRRYGVLNESQVEADYARLRNDLQGLPLYVQQMRNSRALADLHTKEA